MAAVGEEALPAPVPPEGPLRAAANPRALATAVREVEAGLSARRDDPAGASALLLRAARRPALGDWARALAAEAAARTGDVEGARAALSWLPTDLALSWGFRAEALALLEAGEPAAAVGAAVAGLGRSRTGPDSAAARWLAGRALVETGDTAAARRHLRQGARGAPGAVGTARSAEALERLGSLSDEDRLALVLYRVRRGDLTVAGRALDGMVRDGTAGPVVAEASLELARALSFRGRHEEGERVAARAIPGSPGPAAAALHVEVARARLRGRSDAPARPPLEAAVEAAPSSPAAQAALFILADLDEDAGEPERARARFARAADLDPTTDVGGEAAVREGLLALSAGDIRGAVLRFDAYRAAHPTGWRAQQATYWAAVARLRAGDGEDALSLLAAARDVDPTGYYALRAADRSGPGGPDPLAGLPDPPPPDPVEARLAQGAVARVEALEALGLTEAAELERLRCADVLAARPGGLHALAEALLERGRVVDAARAGREARRRLGAWDGRLLRVVYPLPWADAIEAAAGEVEMDPALVAALVRQESLFQPDAVSAAGAVGLMQIMPSTARDLARRAGEPVPGVRDLRRPETNLRLGVRHLDEVLRARDGRLDHVLAVYNAGAGRVDRWRALVPGADPDVFVERIPYGETREYVRVVQENAALYRALYWPHPR